MCKKCENCNCNENDEMTFEEQVKQAEQFAQWLYDNGFTDTTDINPVIALTEQGGIRNPQTGMIIYCHIFHESRSVCFDYTIVDKDAVLESLTDAGNGFFSFIGSSLEQELEYIKDRPNFLMSIISSFNAYSGEFQQSCMWLEDIDNLKKMALNNFR